MGKNKFLRKFTEWEYWPSFMFYAPNIPYAILLGIKARSFTFFSSTNPGMKSSGNGSESKFETLELIPKEFTPKSFLVDVRSDFDTVLHNMKEIGIEFPLIAKPDVGFRGNFVKKINNKEELCSYINNFPFKFIIQDFVSLPNECGVFYYRFPNNKSGNISSLTLKSFPSIIGDGKKTINELIISDNRINKYITYLASINKNRLNEKPNINQIIQLSNIGNHCKGTRFINGNDSIDQELIDFFDIISSKIEGWYYGRFDLKYDTLENLKKGKNCKILELNGIISEPNHIYDSYHISYFKALKTIRQHWKIMYEISQINHKNGVEYQRLFLFIKELVDLKRYVYKINRIINHD